MKTFWQIARGYPRPLLLAGVLCVVCLISAAHFTLYRRYEAINIVMQPLGKLSDVTTAPQDLESQLEWPCFHGQENLPCKKMRTFFVGAIGNEMFAFASMMGMARRLKRTPFLPDENVIRALFNMTVFGESTLPPNTSVPTWALKWEAHANIYDPNLEGKLNQSLDIELVGYFQSWKYFRDIEPLVRKEFTFRDEVRSRAEKRVLALVQEVYGNGTVREDARVIGIHVRRGNMMTDANKVMGYTVADKGYMDRAIGYFENAHTHSNKKTKLLFVVCSAPEDDTQQWIKENVFSNNTPVAIHHPVSPAVDLSVLASCDHVIQTVGTFGWWAAFLAGGNSTYFRAFPKANSSLGNSFCAEDYNLPEWIPL